MLLTVSSPAEVPDPKLAWAAAQWAHDRPLVSCRFDPTGQYVFCGSEDRVVERFRLSDGARTLLEGGHQTWVNAFAFSSDGAVVISGGCDGRLCWWTATADVPQLVRTVPGHGTSWVRALAASPDGTLLASG